MSPLEDNTSRAQRCTKRRRVRERVDASAGGQTKTNEVGEQQNVYVLMNELSDDETSLILSFVVGDVPTEQDLFELFYTFAYVSKWSYNCCLEYIKRMNGVFKLQFHDLEFAMWLCGRNAKLKGLFYDLERFEDMNIVLRLLRSCDVCGLEELSLRLVDEKVEEMDDYDRCVAIQKGLISHDDVLSPMTMNRFTTSLTEVAEGLQSLKVLHLVTHKQTMILPLLTKLSNQLESLELDMMGVIALSNNEQKDFNKSFEETIESMRKLTHFYWLLPLFKTEDVHAFSIRSQSIQTLALRGDMHQSRYIHECICPSLKRLAIPFYLDDMPGKLRKSFSHGIEDLFLSINSMDDVFDDETDFGSELSTLSSMIERMQHLKKLKIIFCPEVSYPDGVTIGMRIKSKTLEQIDVRHSSFVFSIIECNCPVLKEFKQEFQILQEYDEFIVRNYAETNGVVPNDPVSSRILFSNRGEISLNVEDQRFQGMTIPDSCVIKMKYF